MGQDVGGSTGVGRASWSRASGPVGPQGRQDVKMHPPRGLARGGQHFLSSPLGGEVPRAWRGRRWGAGTLLRASLLLANQESAPSLSCEAPLETDPISTQPISFVDICKCASVKTAFVSGLKSQSVQVGSRRGTQLFAPLWTASVALGRGGADRSNSIVKILKRGN